jgi:DNA-binding MarR family transcriptional regulator
MSRRMERMPAAADSLVPTPDLGDLMHVAFRRLRRGWSEQLAPFDLTPYQFRALQAVARGPHDHDSGAHGAEGHGAVSAAQDPAGDEGSVAEGVAAAGSAMEGTAAGGTAAAGSAVGDVEGLRLKDLAERLRIAPRSATEVVDQLQDKGLVERRPDPVDRRATRIVLTEGGARVRAQVREERRRQAGDYFSVLSAPDRVELARILSELVGSHP